MDRGHIVEEGDHRTLLEQGGLYARLWAHQSGGFLGEDVDDDESLAKPRAAATG
jgi:ATP-binding cassette subfamily B multidrug efflux pump